jgi:hypothetical protein
MPSQPIARPPRMYGQDNPSRSAALDLDSSDDVTQTRSGPSSSLGSNIQHLPRPPLLSLSCSTSSLPSTRPQTEERGRRIYLLSQSVLGRITSCRSPDQVSSPQAPRFDSLGARHCPTPPRTTAESRNKRTERKVLQDQAPSCTARSSPAERCSRGRPALVPITSCGTGLDNRPS